jgi:hypothetical protein
LRQHFLHGQPVAPVLKLGQHQRSIGQIQRGQDRRLTTLDVDFDDVRRGKLGGSTTLTSIAGPQEHSPPRYVRCKLCRVNVTLDAAGYQMRHAPASTRQAPQRPCCDLPASTPANVSSRSRRA